MLSRVSNWHTRQKGVRKRQRDLLTRVLATAVRSIFEIPLPVLSWKEGRNPGGGGQTPEPIRRFNTTENSTHVVNLTLRYFCVPQAHSVKVIYQVMCRCNENVILPLPISFNDNFSSLKQSFVIQQTAAWSSSKYLKNELLCHRKYTCIFVTKPNWLMLFGGIIAVYFGNHTKHTHKW
jgi:hypothetical protein